MTKIYMFPKRAALLLPLLLFFAKYNTAQIIWPEGQLLPSFPATASNQDLSTLSEKSWRWEAEGPSISHHTGRPETDGWLCQTGIDAANQFMVYGPYDTSLTAGRYKSEFRMKVDNKTAHNTSLVGIDAPDPTTRATPPYQAVTPLQISGASNSTP